jgi:hypothetical protein
MSLGDLGITKKNLKRAIVEALIFSPILLVASSLAIKSYLLHHVPLFYDRLYIDPFAIFKDPEDRTWQNWIVTNAIYCFFLIPIQEVLVRGGLQGFLEKFLEGRGRVLFSILISNLIFSSVHVFFSVYIAFSVFITGLYIGWGYSRTHNLFGCWISHVILGGGFLSIFGFYPLG